MIGFDPRDADVPSLPMSLEAEQALLGALMFDNAIYERLPDRLRGAHFYEPFHHRLYDAIETSIRLGILAEPTLLVGKFSADPAFAEFGGLRYLADLMDRAPPAFAAPDYAREIFDLALRRELIRVAGEIKVAAADPDRTGLEHIETAEGALYALVETGEQAGAVQTFRDALQGAMDAAAAAYARDGKLTGMATLLNDLDYKLGGLHPSDLLILAGRPSMGKTALATNIAFNVAKTYQWAPDPGAPNGRKTVAGGQVLFYSLEMSGEQLATRILAEASGVPSEKIRRGEIEAHEFSKMRDAQDLIAEIPLHIDATGGQSIAKLRARARRQKRRTGLDLIVVDYLQLVTVDGQRGGSANRVQEVTAITGGLKALAKELNVPILALSQLSRKVEERDDKRPQLADLRESGSIEQDADAVMFVYREEYYLSRTEPEPGSAKHLEWTEEMSRVMGQAEVIIGKQRHGPIGTVRLAFDGKITKFGNLARTSDYGSQRLPYGDA